MRKLLIREAHEGGLMGHFGIAKTLDVLYYHFYWPNIKKMLLKFVISALCVNKLSLS